MSNLEDKYLKALELLEKADEKNEKKGFEILLDIYKKGYSDAAYAIGYCYFMGIGTDTDMETSFPYFEEAAEQGNSDAYPYLGALYCDGIGVEEDRASAYCYFRLAADAGNEDAKAMIEECDFTQDEMRNYYSIISEITFEPSELEGYVLLSEEGDVSSAYIVANHFFMHAEDKGVDYYEYIENALDYSLDAYRRGMDIARDLTKKIINSYINYEAWETVSLMSEIKNIPLIDGHEPNAVLVNCLGRAEPIYIEDFSSGEELGSAIGCDRINIVSTMGMRKLSEMFDCTVVGYVDERGQLKELLNNSIMSTISGYRYLAGQCVLTGFEDGDYSPLSPKYAIALAKWLSDMPYTAKRVFDLIRDGIY